MRTQYNSSGSCPEDSPGGKNKFNLCSITKWSYYLKICLSFRLECDNHETDKDVDHEESEDDDVDEVEHKDDRTVAFFGTNISFVRVDGDIENPEN